MKRALLVIGLLAAALYLLWSFSARAARPRTAAPQSLAMAGHTSGQTGEVALESASTTSGPTRASIAGEPQAKEPGTSTVPASEQALIRVTVLYAGSRAPVQGAAVKLWPQTIEKTDAAGVAELEMLQSLTLGLVRIDPTDGGDVFVPYAHTFDEPLQSIRTTLEVLVDRGFDLRGIVRDAATGRPIKGAKVAYRGFGLHTHAVSGEDGSFTCAGLLVNPKNLGMFTVEHEGYLGSRIAPKATDLEAGAAPLDVLLEPGITVSGRVLDTQRRPVTGVYLQLHTPESSTASSDELGRFEFRGIRSTEQASISVQSQPWSGEPILEKSLDLGALDACRFDIELEVQSALEVRVSAELLDGTNLDASRFEVEWGDGSFPRVGSPEPPPPSADMHVLFLPRGPDVELYVSARAPGTDDPRAILRGSARVHTEASVRSPLEVRVRLGETGRLEIPPAPAGAGEVELGESSRLLGALDVQLIDARSGRPIEDEDSVVLLPHPGQSGLKWLNPGPDGWVRIWNRIGTNSVYIRLHDGPYQQVTISIPRTGHAKTEWRLRTRL